MDIRGPFVFIMAACLLLVIAVAMTAGRNHAVPRQLSANLEAAPVALPSRFTMEPITGNGFDECPAYRVHDAVTGQDCLVFHAYGKTCATGWVASATAGAVK
jgi:hypothetical protein